MTVLGSVSLFVLAALAEIGGAWLVWQGLRKQRELQWVGAEELHGPVGEVRDRDQRGRRRASVADRLLGLEPDPIRDLEDERAEQVVATIDLPSSRPCKRSPEGHPARSRNGRSPTARPSVTVTA